VLSRGACLGRMGAAFCVGGAAVLPGGVLAAGAALVLTGGANDGLAPLAALKPCAGGIIDVLLPTAAVLGAILARGFVAVVVGAPVLLAGGVFVREEAVLPAPLTPNCFVGLLVGLRNPLRALLALGVGLPPPPPTPLILLSASCFLTPLTPACTLLGRLLVTAATALGLGFSTCSSTCLTPAGRRNMP
jgi:hypothetical protein